MEERTAPPVPHGNHRAGAVEDRQRELLEMTRRRLLFELDAATHPRHREQKEKAIAHIDEQLAQLPSSSPHSKSRPATPAALA